VIHRYTIADSYGIELKRYAACFSYSLFHGFSYRTQMHMTWNNLSEAVDNAQKGLIQVFSPASQSIQQSPVWRALYAHFYDIAFHVKSPVRITHQSGPGEQKTAPLGRMIGALRVEART
jgi:hypothetical protein